MARAAPHPRRALRVEDFARVTGMAPEAVEALRAVATVQSGRPGVAPEAAPAEVLAVLGADRAEDVPEGFVSALSGVNFRVELVREGGVRVLGVVHVAAEAGMGRVLEG